MQALKLVFCIRPGHRRDRGHRMGVVGRELRIKTIRVIQQPPRAGEKGNVARDLPGKDGIALRPHDLMELDFRIPISPFHQTQGNFLAVAGRQIDEPVDHRYRALLIRLHDRAEAVPGIHVMRSPDLFEQVEREFQPVGLLGIHGQAHIGRPGAQDELGQPRSDLVHDPVTLEFLIARMKRGELYGNARTRIDGGVGLLRMRRCDHFDRAHISLEITVGVGHGPRRLAQHVERMANAALMLRAGLPQSLLDRPPQDELAAHDAHGVIDGLPDDGLARA